MTDINHRAATRDHHEGTLMTTSSSSDSTTAAPARGNLDDRDYQQLRERVAARFAAAAAAGPLFTTDVDLWPDLPRCDRRAVAPVPQLRDVSASSRGSPIPS